MEPKWTKSSSDLDQNRPYNKAFLIIQTMDCVMNCKKVQHKVCAMFSCSNKSFFDPHEKSNRENNAEKNPHFADA